MDDYIAKPVDRKVLAEVLERWVHGAEKERSASTPAGPCGMPILNRNRLLEQVDNDPEMLAEVIDLFLDDSTKALVEIRNVVSSSDASAIEQCAHKLKGALMTLTAKPAADAARRLEEIGREGDLGQAAETLSALEQQMEELRQQLSTVVKSRVVHS